VTFIHSKTSARTLHAGPGQKIKIKGASSGLVMRALSPEARQASLGPAGGKGAVQPALAKRPARRSLLLGPDPRLRPPQPPAQSFPGRATEKPPWEVHGARFLLLPPAPRAEAVARATELAVQRGSALSATGASSPFGPRSLATRERRRGGGAAGGPQPTCGPGPRHQGDKDTRNHRSRRCHHHRKRLSGRETTGRKLPLSRIWYLPLLHRPLPSPTPACHPAPTVERKCAFPDPIMPSEAELGGVLSQVSHQKSKLEPLVPGLKMTGTGPTPTNTRKGTTTYTPCCALLTPKTTATKEAGPPLARGGACLLGVHFQGIVF
jgi:hypothetical protein